jgi:plastocyanin
MNGTIRVLPAGAPIPSIAQQMAAAARQYQTAARNTMAHEATVAAHLPPSVTKNGHTTWNVMAGAQYGRVVINEFLPRNITVKSGDSVNWIPGGFHTVASRNYPLPALAAACEQAGPQDRPYNPFSGSLAGCSLEFGFGPGMFGNVKSGVAWTGQLVDSGNLVIPQPHPFAASFPKAGTFHYVCLVHPHMAASVTIR